MREIRIVHENNKFSMHSKSKELPYYKEPRKGWESEQASERIALFPEIKRKIPLPIAPESKKIQELKNTLLQLPPFCHENIVVTQILSPSDQNSEQFIEPEQEESPTPSRNNSLVETPVSHLTPEIKTKKIESKKSQTKAECTPTTKKRRDSYPDANHKCCRLKLRHRSAAKKIVATASALSGTTLLTLGFMGYLSTPAGWISLASVSFIGSILFLCRLPRKNEIYSLNELLNSLPKDQLKKIDRFKYLKERINHGKIDMNVNQKELDEFNKLSENKNTLFFSKLDENSFKTNPYYLNVYISYIYAAKNKSGNAYKLSLGSGTPPDSHLAEARRRYGF